MDQNLHSVGSIVRSSHPDFLISKQKIRQIQGIEVVRLKRKQDRQTFGFASRAFVLCALPARRAPTLRTSQRPFRPSGDRYPDFGLPFGQDRPASLSRDPRSLSKEPTIRFSSAAEMLDTFAMAKGGKEYRRLVAAFERIFRAKIFGAEPMTATARVVHRGAGSISLAKRRFGTTAILTSVSLASGSRT